MSDPVDTVKMLQEEIATLRHMLMQQAEYIEVVLTNLQARLDAIDLPRKINGSAARTMSADRFQSYGLVKRKEVGQ